MDAVMQKQDVRRDGRLRFPSLPLGGLAGTSFKHEHFKAILRMDLNEDSSRFTQKTTWAPAAHLIGR